MLAKINGKSVKKSEIIRNLLYLKTLLSKLKPIEKKIDYQVSKLIKMSGKIGFLLLRKFFQISKRRIQWKKRKKKIIRSFIRQNLRIDEIEVCLAKT